MSATNTQQERGVSSVGIKGIRLVGNEPVYNMEVEDTHCFAVNGGLIVHNCADAVRYLCATKRLARKIGEDMKEYRSAFGGL